MSARAIVVTPDLTRTAGGMRHSVPALWRATSRTGIGVEVHTPRKPHIEEDAPHDPLLPLTAHRVAGPLRFSWCPDMAEALRRALERGPAVLSLHGLWMGTGLAVHRAVAATGAPLVVHPHGMLESWAMGRSRGKKAVAMRLFEGANLRGAACLRALNTEEAARFRELGLSAPIAVIPNPVETREPGRRARTEDAPRTLLFLSRLHPKKGVPELLHAWAMASPAGWRLDIAGPDEGGHRADLEALARQLALGDRVRFVGALEGAAREAAFDQADAFVLPSHSEGLPMAVLEAAARGLPVVLTPGCHFPELAHCGGGQLADPERHSLAAAITGICGLPDEARAAMGEAGRALVSERCRPAVVGEAMAGVVRWLLGAGDRPGCVQS